jgi:alkanesulfonate monooxygenase SsuD/methylene tetrahydromethanopterin reductase-like flavin-dependent oxidoreductase (luciferase family)
MRSTLHLAVALDGAGWHPAAWRSPDAQPDRLFTAGYWIDLIQEAERGLVDFVTIEDALHLQADGRVDRVRGRLDAVLIAARVAPRTRHVGLVPTVIVTHTEPFHASKAIATLDYVSSGRAGVRVKVSRRTDEAAHFGRRTASDDTGSLFEEATDYVEVMRRLWDSWEDDAEIRDVDSGRFIDREKLHYIDFTGRWFSVKGPSITPRPPQGQPVVAALGHSPIPYRFIGRSADVGFVTPRNASDAGTMVNEVGGLIFADLVVFLGDDAVDRKERLDEWAGVAYDGGDAAVFVGTVGELADLMVEWQAAGVAGFRLRPGELPYDLVRIARELGPELRRRGAFRHEYDSGTLRGLLGLPRPVDRYATS